MKELDQNFIIENVILLYIILLGFGKSIGCVVFILLNTYLFLFFLI